MIAVDVLKGSKSIQADVIVKKINSTPVLSFIAELYQTKKDAQMDVLWIIMQSIFA